MHRDDRLKHDPLADADRIRRTRDRHDRRPGTLATENRRRPDRRPWPRRIAQMIDVISAPGALTSQPKRRIAGTTSDDAFRIRIAGRSVQHGDIDDGAQLVVGVTVHCRKAPASTRQSMSRMTPEACITD